MGNSLNSPNVEHKLGTLSKKLISEVNQGKDKVYQKIQEVDQFHFISERKTFNAMMERLCVGFCKRESGEHTIKVNGTDINGEWVQGYYVKTDDDEYIYTGKKNMSLALSDDHGVVYYLDERYKIIPGTKCMISEYVDKLGNAIKEHDILIIDETKYVVRMRSGCFALLNPRSMLLENGIIPTKCFSSMLDLELMYGWHGKRANNAVVCGNIFENKSEFKELDAESRYDLNGFYRGFVPAIINSIPENVVIHRGKHFFSEKCYGKWVYGKLVFGGYQCGEPRWYIDTSTKGSVGQLYHVLSDTICKYIGEQDTNGNPIFQRDIIQIPNDSLDHTDIVIQKRSDINYSSFSIIGNSFEDTKLMNKIEKARRKKQNG